MNEMVSTDATLCFPVRDGRVLLAEKQKKIGAGLLNGFGGKAESGDTDIAGTNAREVAEEIGISITKARKVGEVVFNNPSDDKELRVMRVHIFLADDWKGEPKETDEAKKLAWYEINELDYSKFLAADSLFLPQIFRGECIRGEITYNDDWSVRTSRIVEVSGQDYE